MTDKGGICLEGDYLGRTVRHRLWCQEGHEWQPQARKILEGSWCPDCGHAAMVEKLCSRAGSLEALQVKAAEHGGRCLSTAYVDLSHRYAFECAEGHRWTSASVNVMGCHCCRRCCNVKHSQHMRHPEGMARIPATARAKGGVCLDNTYHGVEATYRFRCKAGHVWSTYGQNVLFGRCCMACYLDSLRLGIEKMHAIAHERGGRCLSTEYVNTTTKLTWECHRGHVWRAIPGSIVRGSWCQSCAFLDMVDTKNKRKRERYERAPGYDE